MTSHPLEALSAWLDGELMDAQRREVEAHLAGCVSCARHLEELRAVDTLARGLPSVAVPDGYLEALPGRVRARIRADRPAAAARAPWVWPLAAGLALAVLAPLLLRDGPLPAQKQAAQEHERLAQAPAPSVTPAPVEEKAAAPEAGARPDAPRRQATGGLAAAPSAKAVSPRERAETTASEAAAADARMTRDDAPEASTFAREPAAAAPPVAAIAGARPIRESEAGNEVRPTDEERAFAAAGRRPITTAGAARRARAAWLRYLADHPSGARADEARVRLVEASVSLFRATGDDDDRRAAEKDAAAYLSSPDARQAARVRAALRRLDDPR